MGGNKITGYVALIKDKLLLLKSKLDPGPKAWQGAAMSLLICSGLLFFGIFIGAGLHSLFNGLINLGFAVLLFVLSMLLGSLIVQVLGWVQLLQLHYRRVFFGALFLLIVLMFATVELPGNVTALTLYFIITSSLLGAGLNSWSAAKKNGRPRLLVPASLGIAGGLGLLLLLAWFIWPGLPYQAPDPAVRQGSIPEELLILEHPAETGSYRVLKLTYGSGTDKHRSEYGQHADITTGTVDVSKMVDPPMVPVLWIREMYWGFGLDAVPLNARVWFPEGDGTYPLVLVVHGNHIMDDFSDPGYDYLGELLASRGYIVASIDQNFLNAGGFIEAILGGLRNENDARAYLLLRHLEQWHTWNETTGHLFEGMVDTENIGLIGHSRGGEAAAIAAVFNNLSCHPGHGDIQFDFGFNIKSVIAIAPSDGQFQPRRQKTDLNDINYLVLHGSADSDVRSFQGAMQYDRVSITEEGDHFKASVYIDGANHGQFNTRWGRIDQTFSRLFLDRANIMPEEMQELAAKTFISSFLEDTLKGSHEYRQLFRDPLMVQTWVPQFNCHIQFLEGTTAIIAGFEEDLDLKTLTIEGGKARGENFLSWREEPVELGSGRLRDSVSVTLSWDYERLGEANYALILPESLTGALNINAFTFAAANGSDNREPIDFTIIMRDRSGEEAMLPLSHIGSLPPPPQYRIFKKPLGVEFSSEPVFSTYTFPLSDFTAVNRSLDLQTLTEIEFLFDSSSGTLHMNDMGFTR